MDTSIFCTRKFVRWMICIYLDVNWSWSTNIFCPWARRSLDMFFHVCQTLSKCVKMQKSEFKTFFLILFANCSENRSNDQVIKTWFKLDKMALTSAFLQADWKLKIACNNFSPSNHDRRINRDQTNIWCLAEGYVMFCHGTYCCHGMQTTMCRNIKLCNSVPNGVEIFWGTSIGLIERFLCIPCGCPSVPFHVRC